MSSQIPVDLSVNLAGIDLANPFMNASGTISLETAQVVDLRQFGALVTKGVTLSPRSGNITPRLCETSCGLINSIGLENSGLEVFLADELPIWLSFGVPVLVNISGADSREYYELAKRLDSTGVAGVEVNVSCPNREGLIFGSDPEETFQVVAEVSFATSLPVFVKLTPNVTNIQNIAHAAISGGASALSLVNTFLAMDVDVNSARPKIGRGFGGLSGPAILPQALFKVWQVCQFSSVPVVGMGGIGSFEDAVKFLMVGAKAVAIGTANFTNPLVIPTAVNELRSWMEKKSYKRLAEIPALKMAEK